MPIYEYECDAGHRTEKIEKRPQKTAACGAPGCGFIAWRRPTAAVGIFKGAGFDKGNTNERRVRWN